MFYLDLEQGNNTVSIEFKEVDTPLGKKWAEALRKEIDKGIFIPQPDRIYNLNNKWTEDIIINTLNKCINTINEYDNFIDYTIPAPMTQEASNHLHHYFEKMRGEAEEPNEFYKNSPEHVQEAIEEYNVQIHRWEDLGASGRIVVHILDRPTTLLEDEDYNQWSLDTVPGDVRLNYCHKGKPLWDVFKDGDDVVGEDNIRPQFKYSADFQINFGQGPGLRKRENLDQWWEAQGIKLNKLGFHKDNPKNAVGWAVVGKVAGDPIEVKSYIFNSTKILGVRYV